MRASGPGGQNVNRSRPPSSCAQRRRVLAAGGRGPASPPSPAKLTADGVLLIDSREHRTQAQNRAAARARLAALLQQAALRPKKRRKTRPSSAARERRLVSKSQRAHIKAGRGRVRRDED